MPTETPRIQGSDAMFLGTSWCSEGLYCLTSHPTGAAWTDRTWRWRHHDPSEQQKLLIQQHGVTPQKNWIVSKTAAKTSNHGSTYFRGSHNNELLSFDCYIMYVLQHNFLCDIHISFGDEFKTTLFWDVSKCSLVDRYWHFEGTCQPHFHNILTKH